MARKISYTGQELAWIERNATLPFRELHTRFCEKFDRGDVSPGNLKALRLRKGWLTGRTGHFKKGSIPANKGKKGFSHPNSVPTQFKKGSIPANAKPLWHERICPKNGIVLMKVPERNPYTGAPTRYKAKQIWLYEQANGPIPSGMVLRCLDGDKTNCDPSNWKLITKRMNGRLNSQWSPKYADASPEAKKTLLATAELDQKIHDLTQSKISIKSSKVENNAT